MPPAAPELPSADAPLSLDSLLGVELDELSPVVGVVDVVAVVDVDVEVVSVASFSADVSFGGVISGVLFGVASETLVPPQEERPTPERRMSALAASATVRERDALTLTCRADPSAGRR